jgi:hypothetical protein
VFIIGISLPNWIFSQLIYLIILGFQKRTIYVEFSTKEWVCIGNPLLLILVSSVNMSNSL